MKRRLLAVALGVLAAAPAHADYQVRGRFLYRDRLFNLSGFTGGTTDRPIRYADVELLDASSNVLGQAGTDANGSFVMNVIDSQTRDLRVRVLTRANNTPSFKAQVKQPPNYGGALYAVTSQTFASHNPTQDIDFTASPVIATSGSGGEAFNIWDQAADAFDFIASLSGSRPTRLLTLYWAAGNELGTYYQHSTASIYLYGMTSDSDAWDDTVILHEIGHYTEFNLAESDNPGGPHGPTGYYDLRLTWSEGQSTFFANMVRNWRGFSRPDIYVDTTGQPGTGQAFLAYDVEGPSLGSPGANNEVSVNAALWETADGPGTQDATPGSDDDGLDLASAPAAYWDVMTQHIEYASTISLEDFWDGWFARGHGFESAMRAAFAAAPKKIEYYPDAAEADDSTIQARTVVAGSGAVHRTTYGAGDLDYTLVGVLQGGNYVFETQNLLSGADTRLTLFASDGTTVLAQNDDRGASDLSSRIAWTAPASGYVFVRCQRKSDGHTYGSYDLLVSGPPVAVDVSDVRITATAGGVELRWRVRRTSGLTHFDVERADAESGPWAVRNAAPLVPGAGTEPEMVFVDAGVEIGTRLFYRLVGVETTGERTVHGPYEALATPPARLVLHAPRPNPFNPSTSIGFELPAEGRVTLRIYAADGRLVRTLLAGATRTAGTHTVLWDGRGDGQGLAASGVYLVQLETSARTLVQRAVLVR